MRNKSPRTAPELRVLNRGLVLRTLRDEGALPRAELAKRTGLSATTITKVVAQLIDEGSVAERDTTGEARVGRPAIDVALVPGAYAVCGVQIRVGEVQVGLCDLRAGVIAGRGFAFDVGEPAENVLDRTAETAREMIDEAGIRMLGVGVAVPGPVDPAQRANVLSINLGWRHVPFADHLEAALGLPTLGDHNVRAMALAESRYGVGVGADSLLYVYVRSGVGAGLTMRGEPFRPGTHGVTELGHLRVVEKGRLCACGNSGCLETVASEPYLTEQVRAVVADEPDGPLAAALAGQGLLAGLETAARGGDPRADAILRELAEHLTTGLASAVNLLNPELIVMGGVFAGLPDAALERVRAALRFKAFPLVRDTVRVVSSELGIDAGVVGGAATALDRFFYSPERNLP